MKTYKLTNFVSVDFTSDANGSRVGLFLKNKLWKIKVNPTEQLGKIGIKVHHRVNVLADVLKVEVKDKQSNEVKQYHLNRKSTIKWLNSLVEKQFQLPLTCNVQVVAESILNLNRNINITLKNKKKSNHPDECISHIVKTRISVFTLPKALFWNKFYHWSLNSWSTIQFRFFLNINEKTIVEGSKALGVLSFKNAKKTPAYKNHINGSQPFTFAEIPITSKESYIKPALFVGKDVTLYHGGKLPNKAKRDTSTGTTGKSTPWWRGRAEQENVQKVMMYASKVIIGNKPFTAINGFALGPWATGITGALAFANDPNASVINIGPNTLEMLEAIQETVRMKGKNHPIAVAGYPPYMRNLVDEAIKKNIPLHEYNLIAVVGGEPMSENQRDLIVRQLIGTQTINRTGFKQCYSSYGASDLDINIGYESDFEIELRKECFKNKDLAKELFGDNSGIPMIFHYDPLNYMIEYDEDHNLIYTCVRQDRISPRVRYLLGDKGKTIPLSDVLATLKKYNVQVKHKPGTNLPLLFIWGRDGELVSFRASKVFPANIADTLKRMESNYTGLNEHILHYGIYQHDVKRKTVTEFLLEVDTNLKDFEGDFYQDFLTQLQISNTDIKANLTNCPDEEKPVLRLFKKGKSPMHEQQVQNPHRKKQYIFGLNLKPNEAKALYNIVKEGKLIRV